VGAGVSALSKGKEDKGEEEGERGTQRYPADHMSDAVEKRLSARASGAIQRHGCASLLRCNGGREGLVNGRATRRIPTSAPFST
jgi:hypothetical protein